MYDEVLGQINGRIDARATMRSGKASDSRYSKASTSVVAKSEPKSSSQLSRSAIPKPKIDMRAELANVISPTRQVKAASNAGSQVVSNHSYVSASIKSRASSHIPSSHKMSEANKSAKHVAITKLE